VLAVPGPQWHGAAGSEEGDGEEANVMSPWGVWGDGVVEAARAQLHDQVNKLSRFLPNSETRSHGGRGRQAGADVCNGQKTGDPGRASKRQVFLAVHAPSQHTRRRRSGAHRDHRVPIASRRPGCRSATPQTNTLRRSVAASPSQTGPWRHSKTRAACPFAWRTRCSPSVCSSSRQRLWTL
jgi:hypothetical protein